MHVLLVEDDPSLQMLTRMSLERGGMRVTVAADGLEGLEALAETRFDGVLLDVMMPGLDGEGMLTEAVARGVLHGAPVAFMTAGLEPPAAARYRALGAVGVIAKPYDPMTLADEVLALFGER